MSPTFPFPRLTHIPQQNVLGFLNVFDLFKFSLSSARAKSIAQSQNRPDMSITVNVNLNYEREMVVVVHNSNENDGSVCCFVKMIRREDEVHFGTRNEFMIDWTEPTEESRMAAFEKTVRHMQDLFPTGTLSLLFLEPYDLRNSFLFNLKKGPELVEMPEIEHDSPKFSVDNVKFVLEEISIDFVHICGEIEPGYICSAPLKSQKVYLKTAHWLKLDAILNMETQESEILDEEDLLSIREIRLIIEKWLSGGLENLKSIVTAVDEETKGNADLQKRRIQKIMEGVGELRRSDGKTARWEFDRLMKGLKFVVEEPEIN